MRTFITLLFFLTVALFGVAHAAAQVPSPACAPIYGGGTTCQKNSKLVVNKTVKHPQTVGYVDNLGTSDAPYTLDQEVQFRIVVSNTGNSDISDIQVTDTLPRELIFARGNGTYDKNTNAVRMIISKLAKGQSQTFSIVGRINTQAITKSCMTNQVSATADRLTTSDASQFCVQNDFSTFSAQNVQPTDQTTPESQTKGGFPVVQQPTQAPSRTQPVYPAPSNGTTNQSPSTGPEALGLLALASSGAFGYFLRKNTRV